MNKSVCYMKVVSSKQKVKFFFLSGQLSILPLTQIINQSETVLTGIFEPTYKKTLFPLVDCSDKHIKSATALEIKVKTTDIQTVLFRKKSTFRMFLNISLSCV